MQKLKKSNRYSIDTIQAYAELTDCQCECACNGCGCQPSNLFQGVKSSLESKIHNPNINGTSSIHRLNGK